MCVLLTGRSPAFKLVLQKAAKVRVVVLTLVSLALLILTR